MRLWHNLRDEIPAKLYTNKQRSPPYKYRNRYQTRHFSAWCFSPARIHSHTTSLRALFLAQAFYFYTYLFTNHTFFQFLIMAKNPTNTIQLDSYTHEEGGSGESVPKTHMRVRYDEKKNLLINHGCWFALDLYNEYRKAARPHQKLKPLKATRFDASGTGLFSTANWFRASLFRQYERIAFFQKVPVYVLIRHAMEAYLLSIKKTGSRRNTYDLINEAMEEYLPVLKKSPALMLLEDSQEELGI